MPIIRHRQDRDYTVLPNALLRDERLWLRDVGLLARMLSLPDEWSFSVAGLRAIIPGVGRDGLRDSLRRIEAAGYLRREKKRGIDGKIIGEIWTITDEPETALPSLALPSPDKATQQINLLKQNNYHTKKESSYHVGETERSNGQSRREYNVRYDW